MPDKEYNILTTSNSTFIKILFLEDRFLHLTSQRDRITTGSKILTGEEKKEGLTKRGFTSVSNVDSIKQRKKKKICHTHFNMTTFLSET